MSGNDFCQFVHHDGSVLAIIIRRDYSGNQIEFFTDPAFSQQLAWMGHAAGHEILPHYHHPIARNVQFTQEVLILRKGKLRVDFYADTESHDYIGSEVLGGGDVILLASGGHGFKVLEDVEMIEVKQGPYAGPEEKERFQGIAEQSVTYLTMNSGASNE
jgi:hypothetical protein